MEVTDNNTNHNSMSKEEKALNQRYSRAGTKSYHAQQAMGKQDTKMVDKMFEIENLLDDLKAAEGVDHNGVQIAVAVEAHLRRRGERKVERRRPAHNVPHNGGNLGRGGKVGER